MARDRSPTRQPATLSERPEESNVQWDRTIKKLWRCKIDSCSATFKRKGGLVYHRRQYHTLTDYQANIPDQRTPAEYAFIKNDLLPDSVPAMRNAADRFGSPTDRKRLSTPELIDDLRLNASRYVRKRGKFEDCDSDSLQSMLFYGLENGILEAHPSLGFELLATRFLKHFQEYPKYGAPLSVSEGFGLNLSLHNAAHKSGTSKRTKEHLDELPEHQQEILKSSTKRLDSFIVDRCAELVFEAVGDKEKFCLLSCQATEEMVAKRMRQLTKWIRRGGQKHARYLLVPVHHGNHFVLCVGVYIGKLITNILVFDSSAPTTGDLMDLISNFFEKIELPFSGNEVESQRRREPEVLPAPTQNNVCDCGLYVITYMKHFMKDGTSDGSFSFVSPDWFPNNQVVTRDSILRELGPKPREDDTKTKELNGEQRKHKEEETQDLLKGPGTRMRTRGRTNNHNYEYKMWR